MSRSLFAQRDVSLRKLLLLWVLLPQLVLWFAGGFFTYRLAVRYVNQAADAALIQAAQALARTVRPIPSGLMIDFPRAAQEVLEADPSDPLFYTVSAPPGKYILGNSELPPPPPTMSPRSDKPYFYDDLLQLDAKSAGAGRHRVRVSAVFIRYGDARDQTRWMLVQVARGMSTRDKLVHNILLDTLLPLSALILVMTIIVWFGIGAGLRPLNRLRREVEGRSPDNLEPLQLQTAPQEVRGLVGALNDLLAAVRRNVSTQQRFIAEAAHQLRTPLAGLKSQTELALEATNEPALVARLRLVHLSATRGSHLVHQLLMLARTEPGALLKQEMVPTRLDRLALSVVAELVPLALRANLDLGMSEDDPPAPGVTVLAIPLLMRQAITNVIDNAMAYSGAGSEITVSVCQEADQAKLVVRDNGPGIPPELQARVFDRFFRATDTGTGCGLGLSIVKEIVTRHGGTVSIENVSPQGLAVVIRLPLAPVDAANGMPV